MTIQAVWLSPGYPHNAPEHLEVGHTRYNTQLEYPETWNGSNWINAAGEVESIAPDDVEQLAYVSHPFRINCKNNINNNECIKEGQSNPMQDKLWLVRKERSYC